MQGIGPLLGAAFRGELPYWRAYSLFAIQLGMVLVAVWIVLEWYPTATETTLPSRPVAVLLSLLAPGLWIVWASSRNIASGPSRTVARTGILGALALLVYFVDFFWS